jgi:hypothetical protein
MQNTGKLEATQKRHTFLLALFSDAPGLTILFLAALASTYYLACHARDSTSAPPGAAESILSMQRWGAVPERIVDIAEHHPHSLTTHEYGIAIRATYFECTRFAAKIHKDYAALDSQACDLAARELGAHQ